MFAFNRHKRRKEVKELVSTLLPHVSLSDFEKIIEIAEKGHLRHLPPSIIAWQSITTHIRHNHTEYDTLLAEGYDVEAAKHFVLDDMNEKLEQWGSVKFISSDAEIDQANN